MGNNTGTLVVHRGDQGRQKLFVGVLIDHHIQSLDEVSMAGEVVLIIFLSMVEATMVIPFHNRGFPGILPASVGCYSATTAGRWNYRCGKLYNPGSYPWIAVCKGVRCRWDGKWA
jgi:hypothetical protein